VRSPSRTGTGITTRCPAWPIGFRITARRADVLSWIRSHLGYTVQSPGLPTDQPDQEIHVLIDRALTAEAGRQADAAASEPVEGFHGQFWRTAAVGTRSIRYRSSSVGGAVAVIGDRDRPGVWQIHADEPRTAALTVVRLCREIQRMRLAAQGAVLLHSSHVVLPGLGGLLFLGPKGAGKTTLGLSIAQQAGYVVSTDLTFVLPGPDGTVVGAAVPDTNRVAPGTLSRLAARSGVPDVPLIRSFLSEVDGNPPAEKRWMTVLETEVLHRIPSAPAATAQAMVVVEARTGIRDPSVEWLPFADALPALKAEFRPPDHLFAGYWLDSEQSFSHAGEEELVHTVSELRAARLCWDPATHDIDAVIAALKRRFS
jgi:hypothetical protein